MEWVQDESCMGWSKKIKKCVWDGVGTGESKYEMEWVQGEANIGWSGLMIEQV